MFTVLSHSPKRQPSHKGGFTLIELLMVIAVMVILAGITFGISKGVRNAQARAKAKAELAVIAQALETYKLRYGDYPWVSLSNVDDSNSTASHNLMKTLVGWQAFDGTDVGGTTKAGAVFSKQPSLLDVSKLTLSSTWSVGGSAGEGGPPTTCFLVDPWGNPYVFIYKDPSSPDTWDRFGFVLFSKGGDGSASSTGISENTGDIQASFREQDLNRDNIYFGE